MNHKIAPLTTDEYVSVPPAFRRSIALLVSVLAAGLAYVVLSLPPVATQGRGSGLHKAGGQACSSLTPFPALGMATVNIYTQVGLITLIGLIAKNGILIVEFANQLQMREGLSKREAVEQAAAIRLRPILMTTVAMLVAMIPLLTATGPGAVSRFHIGLVIASGLGIGTLFTLFVVPAVYMLLAREHRAIDVEQPESLEREEPNSV